jgi:hypothetical protein
LRSYGIWWTPSTKEEIHHEDPEKDSFTLISGFYWKEVFKPSFIGRLQTGITKIFDVGDRKKKYSTTKFNLIIKPVEKPEPVKQTEDFVITEKSTLREIAEHNPEMFERLMYAAFGPGWKEYFHWKAEAIKEVEEHDSESVESNP